MDGYLRLVDILIAAFVLWGGYKAYRKGFIVELISLVTLVLSVGLAFYLLINGFKGMESYLPAPKWAKVAIFLFAYFIIGMILNKLSKWLQKKIDYSIFDSLDNFAATLLGVLKYSIFVAVFINLLYSIGLKPSEQVINDAQLYKSMLKFHDWLVETGDIIAPGLKKGYFEMRNMLGIR
jgi:membrane protein required for colicin V production